METTFQNYINLLPVGFHSILIKDSWMKIEKTKKGKLKLWNKNIMCTKMLLYCFIEKVEEDKLICKYISMFEINRNQIKVKHSDNTYKIINY